MVKNGRLIKKYETDLLKMNVVLRLTTSKRELNVNNRSIGFVITGKPNKRETYITFNISVMSRTIAPTKCLCMKEGISG